MLEFQKQNKFISKVTEPKQNKSKQNGQNQNITKFIWQVVYMLNWNSRNRTELYKIGLYKQNTHQPLCITPNCIPAYTYQHTNQHHKTAASPCNISQTGTTCKPHIWNINNQVYQLKLKRRRWNMKILK